MGWAEVNKNKTQFNSQPKIVFEWMTIVLMASVRGLNISVVSGGCFFRVSEKESGESVYKTESLIMLRNFVSEYKL